MKKWEARLWNILDIRQILICQSYFDQKYGFLLSRKWSSDKIDSEESKRANVDQKFGPYIEAFYAKQTTFWAPKMTIFRAILCKLAKFVLFLTNLCLICYRNRLKVRSLLDYKRQRFPILECKSEQMFSDS